MTFSHLTRTARDAALGFGIAGGVLLTAAIAAEDAMMDIDGDGLVTLEELQVSYPDVTEDQFLAMDIDASGALDEAELTMATDAGLLPVMEG